MSANQVPPALLHKNNRPLRILIVEDDALIAMDFQDELEDHNADVVGIAGSGELAIQLAQALQPDVVMMDVRLAGAIDGIEAAEVIRNSINSPVVFVTGNGDERTIARIRRLGDYPVLLKPALTHQVVGVIRQVCGAD